MGYSGAVPREDSSGPRTRRGAITKTGNAHLRRVVVEAAWSYRCRPAVGPGVTQAPGGRQRGGHGDCLEGPAPVMYAATGCSRRGGNADSKRRRPSPASSSASSGRLAYAAEREAITGARPNRRGRRADGTQRRRRSRRHGSEHPRRNLCDRPPGRTRGVSPRQLPTDHDHAARPANIRVINRRTGCLDRHRLCVHTMTGRRPTTNTRCL